MSLTIGSQAYGQVTVISVTGELDLATASELADLTNRLIDQGTCLLVYDLSGLTFCDSTGLTVFVRAKNRLDKAGGWVSLAGPTPIVARVLDVSGLLQVLDTHDSLAQARVAALRHAGVE